MVIYTFPAHPPLTFSPKDSSDAETYSLLGRLHSTEERWSFAGKLSLSCAWPAADGWPLMWVNCLLQVDQLGQLSLSSFWGW